MRFVHAVLFSRGRRPDDERGPLAVAVVELKRGPEVTVAPVAISASGLEGNLGRSRPTRARKGEGHLGPRGDKKILGRIPCSEPSSFYFLFIFLISLFLLYFLLPFLLLLISRIQI
jgi:hypothetical protein